MAATKRRLRSEREKGSVIVELAIIMPLLLLMVAGIIDLGLLFWEQQVLTNAAREGARAAARAETAGAPDITVSQVRSIVQNYLQANNVKDASGAPISLNAANCTYTWDSANPTTLTVALVNIPVRMMMLPNIQTLFGGGGIDPIVNLNARISMAAEWTTPPAS